MTAFRIIPRLDIKGNSLVKGIHLEGLRVLGTPKQFAKYYYENGADEIMYMDVVASLYGRNGLYDLVKETAKEVAIPMLVGGGIRTLEDIKMALDAGADRVSINTAAVKDPFFVEKAVKKFGSSTIVGVIEAIKDLKTSSYFAYTDNGREYTNLEVQEWALRLENIGVGEILITSVDREGTGLGLDKELITLLSKKLSISIIVHGGCNSVEEIAENAKMPKIKGIALASCLHYSAMNQFSGSKESLEGNTNFLKSGRKNMKIKELNIVEIKEYLKKEKIKHRENW